MYGLPASSSVFTENDDTHLMRYIAAERAEVDASADTLQVYEALVSKVSNTYH